jgi:hypothetical protein
VPPLGLCGLWVENKQVHAACRQKTRGASAVIEPNFLLVFIEQSNEGRSRQCPPPNGITEK